MASAVAKRGDRRLIVNRGGAPRCAPSTEPKRGKKSSFFIRKKASLFVKKKREVDMTYF